MIVNMLLYIKTKNLKSLTNLTEENQVALREAGGIETVIRAINEHIRDDKVCLYACVALGSMIEDNRKYGKH